MKPGALKGFALGLGLGLVLLSCASFKYNVYVLRYREGKLNHKKPEKDLPISVCDDTPQSKANCYVMLRGDYQLLRADYIDMERRLEACEKR